MDDMIGVLKLQVGQGDAKDSSPVPEPRTLLLAPEKVLHGNQSSKVASAKASMRASRSPSSRTFFIHAVDPSNAESWMLEVVPRRICTKPNLNPRKSYTLVMLRAGCWRWGPAITTKPTT